MYDDYKPGIGYILFAIALVLAVVAGWVTNIIWTFHQHDLVSVLLGVVGIFIGPIGAIHGIYTWF